MKHHALAFLTFALLLSSVHMYAESSQGSLRWYEPVHAEESDVDNDDESMMEEIEESSESAEAVQEYVLPYPGILPDHPLYFLKQLRDNVLDVLIRDPLKRVEYQTLMADKRYAMNVYLMDKDKYDESLQIAETAEEHFGMIVEEMRAAKDAGREITADMYDTVIRSGEKHQEIVENAIDNSPEDYTESYQSLRKKMDENMQGIRELRN